MDDLTIECALCRRMKGPSGFPGKPSLGGLLHLHLVQWNSYPELEMIHLLVGFRKVLERSAGL